MPASDFLGRSDIPINFSRNECITIGNSPYQGISRHIVRRFMELAELVAPSDFIRKGCVLLAKVALSKGALGGILDNPRGVALAAGVVCMLFTILTVALIVTSVLWWIGIL
jgi:hypothetical protein